MHSIKRIQYGLAAGVAIAGIALVPPLAGPASAQMAIPSDVQETCVVEPATFNGWFEGGQPTPNGAVNPPSSVTFTSDNSANDGPDVCNFYQWGAQMFLWLTSPAGDDQWVFDSPAFFDVSPSINGKRTLIPNTGGVGNTFALRAAKPEDIGETGQAGGSGVLLSQQQSLVYYGIHINEVYGYFLTGQMGGSLPGATTFPENEADLAAVQAYVNGNFPGVDLADPQTLTIELKTSWVDAKTVPDPSQYVIIEAQVPAYDKTKAVWTVNPDPEVLPLALVGMHVVGTVQDHPEFIWATFEHVSNAPDADYSYTNTGGQTVNQPYSSAGEYLFMATGGGQADANAECMHLEKGNIVPTLSTKTTTPPMTNCTGGIVPSNTVRSNPWGSASAAQTDAVIKNNTLVLSINNSVMSQLSDGDIRKNYVQIGGLWTTTPPTGGDAPIPNQTGNQTANMRGSLNLANATMETYHQSGSAALNCFDCHQLSAGAPNSFEAFGLSHIYSEIQPLALPKCTAAEGSLQFLEGGVTCQGAQSVVSASPPCGNQNYQPFSVGGGLGTWETQDQCSGGGGQQPYRSESGAESFMWYACTRYPGDC